MPWNLDCDPWVSWSFTRHPFNQCYCRVKSTCPLLGKCLYKNIKDTVKTNNSVKHYIGATEGTIKQNFSTINFFTNRNYSSDTSLSSYIWHLKDTNISPTIS